MVGMSGGGKLSISSWGWYTDEENVQWRRWSVTWDGERKCFLEMKQEGDDPTLFAYLLALRMSDEWGDDDE